ncbi:MAG: tRNA (guanine(10)-N(2))-dimethyltransferase [Candidatus Micrarchaeota archaeon]
MEEEGIRFTVGKKVFYNPNMNFCRSMSSLAVGAIGGELELCDAFSASGIRGIRYAKENPSVKSVTFIDIDAAAIRNVKANAKKNNVKYKAVRENISRAVFDVAADFLEIDPFGSPSPYLYDAFRVFNPFKKAYLSVTATDVAVLCGGKTKPCLKNYHSTPLNNEFTHETGMRIMVKKVAEVAAEFNMGIFPLVSFSDRHYLKSIMEVRRGAELAHLAMGSLGHIDFCQNCGNRNAAKFPSEKCQLCKKGMEYAGPLWLGELQDKAFISSMAKLNAERGYSQKREIAKMLDLLEREAGLPPYYYNIHTLCRRYGNGDIPKSEELLGKIRGKGYIAERTHYSNVSVKTDAPFRVLKSIFGK